MLPMMRVVPLVIAAATAPAPGAPAISGGPGASATSGGLEQALALLDEMDAATISVDYQNERLVNIVRDLDERAAISLRADWDALSGIGVHQRDEVTLRFYGAGLSTVLAALALQLGDEFERPIVEVYAGQIVLTTLGATTAMCLTDVYDVRDLLLDAAVLRSLRNEAPPVSKEALSVPPAADEDAAAAEESSDEAPEDEGGSGSDTKSRDVDDSPDAPAAAGPPEFPLPELAPPAGQAPPRPLTAGEELMTLIAEHVDPEAWLEYGGSRARIGERNGVVIVTAPATTHRKLRDVLRRLRRANPSGVTLEAAIVDLPREVFARLARRYELSSSALGRAIMLADDADLRWQATSVVALGDRLSAESEREGVAVKLALTPRFDRETGILRIEVEVRSSDGGDRRFVSTTVTIPLRQGGAAIELPGATAGPSVRLLVLIPRRM